MSENDNDSMSEAQNDEEIIALMKKRFKMCEDAEMENRALALDDDRFCAGEQWSADDLDKRKREKRPVLTVNKIPQFVRQVTNEMRQNSPSIKVYPVDDRGDIETAKILQGMTRNIEYSSNAKVAYANAGEGAVKRGFGFFRITTDYVSPDSFDQEIQIKQIANAYSVYLDPASQEPDGSDATFGFIVDKMTKDEFKAKYPDADASSLSQWRVDGDDSWIFDDNSCRIAEYFCKEFKPTKIYQIKVLNPVNQEEQTLVVDASELKKLKKARPDLMIEEIANRESVKVEINWYKTNGEEILERTKWDGSWIPIIPVYGNRYLLDGKWVTESVFRHSKDAQKIYNYMRSAETEAIGLAPKAPYIAAEGQIEDYKQMWATANTETHSVLIYKQTDINGQPAPPPQRNSFDPAIGAITAASFHASEDIKATTGIYDASLGNKSNEQSGRAILARNAQSQTSNFHFIDNQAISIQHCGRQIVELIPKVYDTARVARIIGEDGEQTVVKVNQEYEKQGEIVMHDLSAGKYDVVVDVGPSYVSKRQEAANAMLEFSKSMPQLAANISDLLVKNMDWPGAQEISERLKKLLPPGLAEDKDQKPLPPEAVQQLQQQAQMIEQLTQAANQMKQQIDMKTSELESKERIEMAKIQAQLIKLDVETEHKEAMAGLKHAMEEVNQRLSVLGFEEPIESPIEENFNETGANDGALTQQNNEQGIE